MTDNKAENIGSMKCHELEKQGHVYKQPNCEQLLTSVQHFVCQTFIPLFFIVKSKHLDQIL